MLSPIPFHLSLSLPSHDLARLPPSGGLVRVRRLLDLPDHELERLDDVLVVAGTGLRERALEALCELLAVLGRNLALLGSQIALVADDDDRDPFCALLEL